MAVVKKEAQFIFTRFQFHIAEHKMSLSWAAGGFFCPSLDILPLEGTSVSFFGSGVNADPVPAAAGEAFEINGNVCFEIKCFVFYE